MQSKQLCALLQFILCDFATPPLTWIIGFTKLTANTIKLGTHATITFLLPTKLVKCQSAAKFEHIARIIYKTIIIQRG